MNVMIMIPHNSQQSQDAKTLHSAVKNSLNSLNIQEESDLKHIWVPAFKANSTNNLTQDLRGFKVSHSGNLISSCRQSIDLEMYALP